MGGGGGGGGGGRGEWEGELPWNKRAFKLTNPKLLKGAGVVPLGFAEDELFGFSCTVLLSCFTVKGRLDFLKQLAGTAAGHILLKKATNTSVDSERYYDSTMCMQSVHVNMRV